MSGAAGKLLERAEIARRELRLEEAQRDLVEAVALVRRSGAGRELAVAMKALGRVEREMGRVDVALSLYEEAAALLRQVDDPFLVAHTVRHVGEIHQDAGRTDLAGPCLREALSLYRAHPDAPPLDLANAIRPMALFKESAGAWDEARRLWSEARDLYESLDVPQGVEECRAALSRLGGGRDIS